MTKDIVSKLRDHLAQPIDTECGVVYLLAEVRKLLEQNKPNPKPFALWMYCHWALHVNLSNTNATQHLLEPIDVYVTNTVFGLTPKGSLTIADEGRLFEEFIYLTTFRKQLGEFLKQYSLPTELCDRDNAWFDFMAAYAKVIEDGELSSETKKNNGLEAVEKVTFNVGNNLASGNYLPFTIIWDIWLKDGRRLNVELDAMPNMMMSGHLSLIAAP